MTLHKPKRDIETDGRRLRAEESRKRIVAAMLALVREGDPAPTAEAVAARADVGLRTVFRLFKDMDSLYREMSAVMRARLMPLAEQPFRSADWRARLEELALRRTRIFEELMPYKAAGDAVRARSDYLKTEHAFLVRFQRKMVQSLLPPAEAADGALVEALDCALSFEAWRRLRTDQRLSVERAHAAVLRAVRALTMP